MPHPPLASPTEYLAGLIRLMGEVDVAALDRVTELLLENYLSGARLVLCGNGGSATTASHLVTDFQKNVFLATGRAWEVMALTDSMPLVTAWSNDTDYANVFAGQARCWLRPGDLILALSGSGNSPNVLAAVKVARELGAQSIGFSGFGGGQLAQLVDHSLVVHANQMQQVEDVHLSMGHMLYCGLMARLAPVSHG